MPGPQQIEVPPLDPARLAPLIGPARLQQLVRGAADARDALGGSIVWNISSTATGGGVAEMLHVLLGYANGSSIDARWVVLDGDESFFRITKRLHNRLHGMAGDSGALDRAAAAHYDAVSATNVTFLWPWVRPDDIVILHDPQTAGLAGPLADRGARVVWRCHIGTDNANAFTEEAWGFLVPRLEHCRAYVFSHRGFVPPDLSESDIWIILPSIDPYTAKNRPLSRSTVSSLLARIGLIGEGDDVPTTAGALGRIRTPGAAGPFRAADRVVVQISRWDHLKDMQGVMEGFVDRVAGHPGVVLVLAGPAVDGVTDDPEGARVLGECMAAWEGLPTYRRRTIRLVTLPMDDLEENALLVNALQRHAAVVVQKSLQEGFGLTVAEAMWKSRPVIASAVGGIVDQIAPGTGILLKDPSDLAVFGDTLANLLDRPEDMAAIGRRARRHVRTSFLGDRHLLAYIRLMEHLCGP